MLGREQVVVKHQGRGLGVILVRRENMGVFEDFICFQGCISLFCFFISAWAAGEEAPPAAS